MSDLPKEYPFYKDNPDYNDSYAKYFMFGDSKEPLPDDIKIYNKVGNAYGYMIDCAYIENTSKNIGFSLQLSYTSIKIKFTMTEYMSIMRLHIPFLPSLEELCMIMKSKSNQKIIRIIYQSRLFFFLSPKYVLTTT